MKLAWSSTKITYVLWAKILETRSNWSENYCY